jgi:hypothetical protein
MQQFQKNAKVTDAPGLEGAKKESTSRATRSGSLVVISDGHANTGETGSPVEFYATAYERSTRYASALSPQPSASLW